MTSNFFPEITRCIEWASTVFTGQTPDALLPEMLAYFGNLTTAKKLKLKYQLGFSVIYA